MADENPKKEPSLLDQYLDNSLTCFYTETMNNLEILGYTLDDIEEYYLVIFKNRILEDIMTKDDSIEKEEAEMLASEFEEDGDLDKLMEFYDFNVVYSGKDTKFDAEILKLEYDCCTAVPKIQGYIKFKDKPFFMVRMTDIYVPEESWKIFPYPELKYQRELKEKELFYY